MTNATVKRILLDAFNERKLGCVHKRHVIELAGMLDPLANAAETTSRQAIQQWKKSANETAFRVLNDLVTDGTLVKGTVAASIPRIILDRAPLFVWESAQPEMDYQKTMQVLDQRMQLALDREISDRNKNGNGHISCYRHRDFAVVDQSDQSLSWERDSKEMHLTTIYLNLMKNDPQSIRTWKREEAEPSARYELLGETSSRYVYVALGNRSFALDEEPLFKYLKQVVHETNLKRNTAYELWAIGLKGP